MNQQQALQRVYDEITAMGIPLHPEYVECYESMTVAELEDTYNEIMKEGSGALIATDAEMAEFARTNPQWPHLTRS
jgi:hypothetical protein